MTQLGADARVQASFFDAGQGADHAAVASWTEAMSVMFDVKVAAPSHGAFHGRAGGYGFGELLVGHSRSTAQSFSRSRYRTAQDGLSHYLVQFYPEGACGPRDATSDAWTRPGDLLIVDLAQPLDTAATDYENMNLIIPRRLLAPLIRQPDDVHLKIVPREDPLVSLLRGHLSLLTELAPSLGRDQAALLVEPTVALAAAAINGHLNEASRSSANQSLVEQICRRIETRLADPTLSAAETAAAFAISERKLYYLFQPLGGFSAYVQQRRLRAVRDRLLDPRGREKRIGAIAAAFGFSHRSNFVAAFRNLYGMTPRELRGLAASNGASEPMRSEEDWRSWIVNLS
ncbi:AraC family transcriptional regulator [Brevundimonas intermedia]|uniref:AraC family transcriptional regulator n=1 Tax=Brevundimonas intermedia TaxID=74315 RepID=A0ABQ5TCT0_9CAUL|nr:AraC family transcriptional regulator [Brevundimonas intermedia]